MAYVRKQEKNDCTPSGGSPRGFGTSATLRVLSLGLNLWLTSLLPQNVAPRGALVMNGCSVFLVIKATFSCENRQGSPAPLIGLSIDSS